MKDEVSIFTGVFSTPLAPLQVSFLHHRGHSRGLQVSFLTPLDPVVSIYRCRFYTTPTLPPPTSHKTQHACAAIAGSRARTRLAIPRRLTRITSVPKLETNRTRCFETHTSIS